jgi:DNA-binding NarL/FixJ family response regulator
MANDAAVLVYGCDQVVRLRILEQVARGESVLAPALVRRLITAYVQTPTVASKPEWLGSLTPREVEVLTAVARGMSNAEIGAALHMSAATAKTHVGRLLTKLNARDRTQLVIAAYEAQLVDR